VATRYYGHCSRCGRDATNRVQESRLASYDKVDEAHVEIETCARQLLRDLTGKEQGEAIVALRAAVPSAAVPRRGRTSESRFTISRCSWRAAVREMFRTS
jgi:hypothetical protein